MYDDLYVKTGDRRFKSKAVSARMELGLDNIEDT